MGEGLMARDRANIRTDMWADADWRDLTPGAQWLYEYLLTSPSTSYVGVVDWRPVRIAKMARSLTAEGVMKYAAELEQHRNRFVVTDDETEEILVRSFLRHDGLLLNPNLWKSIGLSFTEVASPKIREAIAREVGRLRDQHPEGIPTARGGAVNPWASMHLRTLVQTPYDTGSPSTPTDTPSPTPSDRGSDRGSPTATATSTTTEASLPASEPKRKEHRLPKDWAPTAEHIARAKAMGVDVINEAENFRLHAETHDRHAANWNGAFTTWLKKARPSAPTVEGEFGQDEWMMRA